MERGSITYWILIILLILTLTGAISLGDIFSLIFYVIGGILLLSIIGGLIFRSRIRRMQREAEEQGRQWNGYQWHFGRGAGRNESAEGEVKLHRNGKNSAKRVGKDVGEYVDFEETGKESEPKK